MGKSLTFLEWAMHHDINARDALCLNLATDKLDADKGSLLGLGICPVSTGEPLYVYVGGGNVEKTEDYHGIQSQKYYNKAVGPKRAMEILMSTLGNPPFVIVYNKEWVLDWIRTEQAGLGLLREYPLFDVCEYVKFLEEGDRLYATTGSDIPEIMDLICFNTANLKKRKGFSFVDICARRLGRPAVSTGNIFEARLTELRELYLNLLLA